MITFHFDDDTAAFLTDVKHIHFGDTVGLVVCRNTNDRDVESIIRPMVGRQAVVSGPGIKDTSCRIANATHNGDCIYFDLR